MSESHFHEFAKQHKIKIQKRKTSWQGFYILQVKKKISKVLEHNAKKYTLRYLQLKVRHIVVRSYLVRIKVTETPKCWQYGQAKQSVEHLYSKCQWQKKEKQKLLKTLYKKKSVGKVGVKKKGQQNCLLIKKQ